jgi:3-oxoacyl-ACP reductase-like protein
VNVDANPRGMPKPEAAAPAPAPVAASAPAAADEAHPGVFSKFKGLFGGRH